MPTQYGRIAQSFILLALATLWLPIPQPLPLSADGLDDNRRQTTSEAMPTSLETRARDDSQLANHSNSRTAGPPYVDAHVECGVAEDGVSDDGPAINVCLKENAGRHIMLRKRGASNAGGGTPTSVDIYSGETITMVGNAQHLDCEVPSLW
jgi:hypothetical protein